jgi:hypothetical protein
MTQKSTLSFIHMGLFVSLEHSIFEFVSDFDLPAKPTGAGMPPQFALVI